MSVISFELKKEHILLLKHVNWSILPDSNLIVSANNRTEVFPYGVEDVSPFGGDDVYDDIYTILYGKPKDFNPLEDFEKSIYTEEEKSYFHQLLLDLPKALSVILYTGAFEVGQYKTKYRIKEWKKKTAYEI